MKMLVFTSLKSGYVLSLLALAHELGLRHAEVLTFGQLFLD
jgi:hypothetical protein